MSKNKEAIIMALFKTNHYRIERNRVQQEENNGLTVTGVRVLLNTWCSKATEEQILKPDQRYNGWWKWSAWKRNLPANWKAVRRRNHLSKGSLFLRPGKENFEAMCPFSIHITMDEENGMPKVETKPGKNFNTERTIEVLEISVSRF